MRYEFLCNGESRGVELERSGDGFRARIGEREFLLDVRVLAPGLLSFLVDGRSVLAHHARGDAGWHLGLGGNQYLLEDPAAAESSAGAGGAAGGDGVITTPMPGKIVEVLVEEGADVESGQPLLILESMKMQNEIAADVSGKVRAIHFQAGDLASFGDPLLEIEPAED